ncbi:MAG: sporulation integral membrane protein YtvI [Anaerolineaceae bacterium]|nr:MAG: sporulation integral membrane protein YtvI [Anaerolineaceae bacterium]
MKIWEDMNERVKLFIKLLIITLGVYLGFRLILPLILPFIIAYLLAWIIRPSTEFLYKKARIPRTIGGSISLIVLIFLIGSGLFYLGNLLIKQAVNFARNIPAYLNILAGKLDNICSNFDETLGLTTGSARAAMDDNILKVVDKVKTDVIPGMTARTLNFTVKIIGFIGILLIILISAVLIIKEAPGLRKKYENYSIYNDINKVTTRLADAGVAYLRAQLLIMVLVAVCCVTGLVVIGNDYALLLGILISILDALPIIGSGMILIPWSIIMLINGNIFAAAVLITVYLLCQIIREVAEPKLIGNRIGIKPLYTLISMYIGLKLFGVAGFILGPVGLIIIIAILKGINDKEARNKKLYALDKGVDLE